MTENQIQKSNMVNHMRVQQLKIQSYRGIPDLNLRFGAEGPTVLIGINGSGKTSILNCISLLLEAFVDRLSGKDDSGKLIFSESDIMLGGEIPSLKNEITLSHAIEGARLNRNLEEEEKDDDLEDLTTFSGGIVLGEDGYYPQNNLDELIPISLRIREQLRRNKDFNIPVMVSYPVNRSFGLAVSSDARTDTKSQTQLEAYKNAFLGSQINFSDFFNWYRYREDLENEQRVSGDIEYRDRFLEAVRNSIEELIPGFADLRIRRLPLRMTVSKDGRELSINQLSDGEKSLLAMVGDLARRLSIANPSLNNPLHGSGIVLIDEIELHLHPQWQRGMIPSLLEIFPNCHFIITTHSPQVLSDVKPDNVYVLNAEQNRVFASNPDISLGRDSNQILEEIMGVSDRPVNIKDDLKMLFRLIDQGDLDKARRHQKELEGIIGDDDPEFAKADILIRRKSALAR